MQFRLLLRAVSLAGTASLAVVGTEALTRWIDGYSFKSLHLILAARSNMPADAITASYVAQIPTAPGVNRVWFTEDPPLASGGSQTPDAELAKRSSSFKGLASVYQWNLEYLRAVACGAIRDPVNDVFAQIEHLFVFQPLGGTAYPRFRYLGNAHYLSGLTTNSFGWRGPEVALNKPDRTIRIAFVGASTTVAPHAARYSYPDYIGHWFQLWAEARRVPIQFEVINAGREGIDSTSMAAIVRDELMPVEPDVVVFYEGANQLWPSDFIQWPGGMFPRRPATSAAPPWKFESVSALLGRVHALWNRTTTRTVEPAKPRLPVNWPASLQEPDPDLNHPQLPEGVRTIIHDLDVMRAALAADGGRLALSSFVWCVWDGMRLDPSENAQLYRQLNEIFWPFSYAHMRRMADFQNRVFAKYASVHSLEFIDVAGSYPLDLRLFSDAVHMTAPGTQLMAWVSFQKLVPVLARLIAAGELPRPRRRDLSQHPAFTDPPGTTIPFSSLRASCSQPQS